MRIYAGIDEAGYGPLLGPMVVGRSVLEAPDRAAAAEADDDLWRVLERGVCRKASDRQGRVAVDDSKKLTSKSAGVKHLERGVLAFAGLAGVTAGHVGQWLDAMAGGATQPMPWPRWYAPCDDRPWDPLPVAQSAGDIAIARAMLIREAEAAGVRTLDMGAAVIAENRFNAMALATRSKAAVSFTFVAAHLDHIWRHWGEHDPLVAVDRQSGRSHYLELLRPLFEGAHFAVLEESDTVSSYRIETARQRMTVRFEVDGDAVHFPVALASMISKYTRELMMARFQRWFSARVPDVKPTAGYALDGQRFVRELRPHLPRLGIREEELVRLR